MRVEKVELIHCECCGKVKERIDTSQYVCDHCGTVMGSDTGWRLELTVFYKGSELTDQLHFCTWQHLFERLAIVAQNNEVDFITFPTLMTDGQGAQVKELVDFITSLSQW